MLHRTLVVTLACLLLAYAGYFVQGCGNPPPVSYVWIWTCDAHGDRACGAGSAIPTAALTRGEQVDYGMEVQVTPATSYDDHIATDIDVQAYMQNLNQLTQPPSTATGDFAMTWTSHLAGGGCPTVHGWWGTGAVNLGDHGPIVLTSQGTLTPVSCSGCSAYTGQFGVWWTLSCGNYGPPANSGTYYVNVNPSS